MSLRKMLKQNKKIPVLLVLLLLTLLVLLHPQIDSPYLCLAVIDPLTAGLVGGSILTGTLGSIFGAKSANDANRMNAEQFKESMKFQRYQYEDSKRYNSAFAQAARARAAGFNPLLAMNGLATSNPIVSSPSANPQQPIDYTSSLEGASQFGLAMSDVSKAPSEKAVNQTQAAKNVAETTGKTIDNSFRYDLNKSSLKKLGYEADTAGYLAKLQRDTLGNQIEQSNLETTRMKLVNDFQDTQVTAQQIINGFLPTQIWAQVNNTLAETALALAQEKTSFMNARSAAKQAAASVMQAAKSNGLRVTDSQAKKLADFFIERIESESYSNWLNSKGKVSLLGNSVEAPYPAGVRRASKHGR